MAEAVMVTLGPRGRTVILQREYGPPQVVNSGVMVAAISANNDRSIGELLAGAIDKVGREGAITIEDGSGLQSELRVVEGMRFEHGMLSPCFVTDAERQCAVLEDASILVAGRPADRCGTQPRFRRPAQGHASGHRHPHWRHGGGRRARCAARPGRQRLRARSRLLSRVLTERRACWPARADRARAPARSAPALPDWAAAASPGCGSCGCSRS